MGRMLLSGFFNDCVCRMREAFYSVLAEFVGPGEIRIVVPPDGSAPFVLSRYLSFGTFVI